MEKCSPACTQLLTLDWYNTLKIFQAKNKLFKACEGIPHPHQPALSKLHLHAIRRLLSAREGFIFCLWSCLLPPVSPFSAVKQHFKQGQIANQSTVSAEKPLPRKDCVSHSPAFGVCSTKTCPASTTETAAGQQEPEGEKRRDEHHLSRHCHRENEWETTGSFQFIVRVPILTGTHSARTAITA